MSASQEKKRRKAEGLAAEGAPPSPESRQAKRRKIRNIIIAVVVVFCIISIFVINSSLLQTALPAVTVGKESYSVAELNYFYYNAYSGFMKTYGEYASYILDPDKPFEDQPFSEDMSFDDYFTNTALDSMKNITLLCDEAKKAGFTLDQEHKDEVDATLLEIESAYTQMGYSSMDQYLTVNYGKGMTAKTMERLLGKAALASAYMEHFIGQLHYEEEEIKVRYQENRNKFDMFTYHSYYVTAMADEENGIDQEQALQAARETADQIARAADVAEFARLVYEAAPEASRESYKDPGHTLYSIAGSDISAAYNDWIYSFDRQEGDTTVRGDEGGYYVVYYIGRDDNDYHMANVRHILIRAEEEEHTHDEGEDEDLHERFTQEAKEAALARAQEIYDQWRSGKATEESFAELANSYSEDGGSNTRGGLYENVYKSMMVSEFDAFCFHPDRQPGDTDIVYGESSSYSGYHIMYYVGQSELYSDYIAKSSLQGEDYSAWLEEKLQAYDTAEGIAYRFAKTR